MSYAIQTLSLPCGDETIEAEAEMVTDDVALHPSVRDVGWTVTHVRTARKLHGGQFWSRDAALAHAKEVLACGARLDFDSLDELNPDEVAVLREVFVFAHGEEEG